MTTYAHKIDREIIEQLIELQHQLQLKLSKIPQSKQIQRGHLRVVTRNTKFYYYLITQAGDSNGSYQPQSKLHLVEQLARQEYFHKSRRELQKNLGAIQKFLSAYSPDSLENIYASLHPGRKILIKPLELSDEDFCVEWKSERYSSKSFTQDTHEYYSSAGQRLRSKSEVIIANLLEENHIPYKYERPFPGYEQLHPDFTCLNPRTRREYIWEHFGMMDNPEYAENAVLKIGTYNQHGYVLGKNLLVTMETYHQPLNIKIVKNLIKNYLI